MARVYFPSLFILFVFGFFLLLYIILRQSFTAKSNSGADMLLQWYSRMKGNSRFGPDDLEKLKGVTDHYIVNEQREEALQALKHVHNLEQDLFGPEATELVKTLDISAGQNVLLNKYDDALPLLWQIYKIQEKTLGPTHLDTLSTLRKLGRVYFYKGNYRKAAGFFKVVYKQRKLLLGPEHLETVEVLFLLGNSLWQAEKEYIKLETAEKIIKYYGQVYKVYSRTWGENAETLGVLYELGYCLVAMKRYEEAIDILRTIMKAIEKRPGSELYDNVENLLGLALTQVGRTEEARQVHKKARRFKNKKGETVEEYSSEIPTHSKFTREVEDQVNSALSLARIAIAEKGFDKALEKLEGVYSIIENDHPRTPEVLKVLTDVYAIVGHGKKAFDTSLENFNVIQKYTNVEASGYNEKVAQAWEVAFAFYSRVFVEYSKEEKSCTPKMKEISERLVSTLKLKKGEEENPIILSALSLAASFLEIPELALPIARKLVSILKRKKEAEPLPNEREKINSQIDLFHKLFHGHGLENYEVQSNMNKEEL